MKYRVKLEVYEGPLDLLLRLVERQEVAAASVSVCEIIDQFMDYFIKSGLNDVEEGSRFLVMVATLLFVKAQLMLSRTEPGDLDEEAERGLLEETGDIDVDFGFEYLSIKEVAAALEKRAEDWRLVHRRPAVPLPGENTPMIRPLNVSLLVSAFKEVLRRNLPPEPYQVQAPQIDIWEKIEAILNLLAHKPEGILFREMFIQNSSKEELIITFLAVLELVYQGKIRVRQDQQSGDIYLAPVRRAWASRGN